MRKRVHVQCGASAHLINGYGAAVQYDYRLVPPAGAFTAEEQQVLARFVENELITHRAAAGVYTVFPDEAVRTLRLPRLLERPDQGDWLNGYVKIERSRVVLGVPEGDEKIEAQLRRLAAFIVHTLPGTELRLEDRPIALEDF